MFNSYCYKATRGPGFVPLGSRTVSRIPRKSPCALGVSCLGQVFRGSEPPCSQACSCAPEAPKCSGAASDRMLTDFLAKASCSCQKDLKILQLPVVVCYSTPAVSCTGLHAFHGAPASISPMSRSKQPSEVSREGTVFPI